MSNARSDRTSVRLRLFENGFTPLPNKNKMCLLKGWSRITVTEAEIESWMKSPPRGEEGQPVGAWKDTGVRCGDILALDFDIDDADTLNDLLDVLVAEEIIPESEFVRIGRPPREMWIYRRVGSPLAKRTTGGFGPADQVAAAKLAISKGEQAPHIDKTQVEVLGLGSQFGAYGKHSDEIEYDWPVKSLLDHDITALPELDQAGVERLVARCEKFFLDRGLAQIDVGGGTIDGHYSRVYDLTDDMVFPTNELGNATVAQIRNYLLEHQTAVLRCTVEALRPSTGGSKAGMASLMHGLVCISDHGTYTAHYPADGDPSAKLARIAEKLRERFEISDEPAAAAETAGAAEDVSAINQARDLTMDPRWDFDDNIEIAHFRFAYIIHDDMVVDTLANTPPMSVTHFRNLMLPYHYVDEGERGGEKIVRLADTWMQSPDRINVGSAQMRPDQPFPFYWADGFRHVNTYRPHVLPAVGGDAGVGLDFLRNLVPNHAERRYLMQWLSYKLQHPHVRGPAVVMVAAARFGTGRGSLGELLTDMFHERYVMSVDFATLTGKTYQSQYNEWLAGSLMVVVNEAADNDKGAGSKWDAKNQAYEHLKNIVDPANTRLQIVRKGLANFQARTYASIFVMTNHADALVIPAEDRRFYVIENGSNQSPDYWVRFHAWRSDPANVGALVRELLAVDLSGYNPYQAPPMTKAKAEMIYAGASELDRAVAHVLAGLAGKLVVYSQVGIGLERYLVEHAVTFPDEWKRTAERIFTRLTQRPPATDRMRLPDGKQHTVRMLEGCREEVLLTPETMLEEIVKNGPTVRTLAGSNVVPLRGKLGHNTDGDANGAAVGS